MEDQRVNTLQGTVREILYDDNKLTISLAYTVEIELDYNDEIAEFVDQNLMEGCEIEVTVSSESMGWKTMSYPHLGHVMSGTISTIKEIY